MDDMSALSDAELESQLLTWSGRVAAGEHRLLVLIGEFDRRGSWSGPGLLSCAHWLVWRTGLSAGAAREKVRVARALVVLPLVGAAMAAGRMSFSQARAVTRVATPEDQSRWVELARHTAASQLDKLVRGVCRVRRTEAAAADPEGAAWRMRTTTAYDDDGNLRITMVFPAEQGAVVTAALDQVQAELDRCTAELAQSAAAPPGRVPADADAHAPADVSAEASEGRSGVPWADRASRADAMLELARRSLAAAGQPSRRTRAQLTAQVDPVSGWARLADGELMPPGSLTAVSSLAQVMRGLPGRGGPPRLRLITPGDLRRHDQQRTARLPGDPLRALLGAVDGERCRFPGCTRHRALHAHHVTSWQDGGGTDLDNLVLLCSRHHTLVHQQGFALLLEPDRTLRVRTAQGVAVLHHPARPWDDPDLLDPELHVTDTTVQADTLTARMDLGYCVMVLMQHAA